MTIHREDGEWGGGSSILTLPYTAREIRIFSRATTGRGYKIRRGAGGGVKGGDVCVCVGGGGGVSAKAPKVQAD